MTLQMRGDWIQTYTGRQFWPLDPKPEDIDINDIAHALANLCRFTGHCREFYSVAQHAVHVSQLVEPADQLWALLHDGAEAYLNDLARPVKRCASLRAYREAEDYLQSLIYAKFGLLGSEPASVKRADAQMLNIEARQLMGDVSTWERTRDHVGCLTMIAVSPCWTPLEGKARFLNRYHALKTTTVSLEAAR